MTSSARASGSPSSTALRSLPQSTPVSLVTSAKPNGEDVKRHRAITIATGGAPRLTGGGFVVPAQFSIRGQHHAVELEGHLHATGERPTLHLTGVLDRHDFGVRARKPFEMVVGCQVHVDVELALEPVS
jgi:polyisoprenoid-binding protein YceI